MCVGGAHCGWLCPSLCSHQASHQSQTNSWSTTTRIWIFREKKGLETVSWGWGITGRANVGVGRGEREKEKEKERGSIGGIEVERDGSFKVRTSTTGSRILELKKNVQCSFWETHNQYFLLEFLDICKTHWLARQRPCRIPSRASSSLSHSSKNEQRPPLAM